MSVHFSSANSVHTPDTAFTYVISSVHSKIIEYSSSHPPPLHHTRSTQSGIHPLPLLEHERGRTHHVQASSIRISQLDLGGRPLLLLTKLISYKNMSVPELTTRKGKSVYLFLLTLVEFLENPYLLLLFYFYLQFFYYSV